MAATPGWYQDPYGGAGLRWWDGVQWTQHVSTPQTVRPAAYTPPVPARRPLPDGTPVYTPWIWLVTLLPLVNALVLLTYRPYSGYARMFADPAHPVIPDTLSLMGGPVFLVASMLSWIVVAVIVVFAWLDYRELTRRGVERPFHWAWSFLGPIVYSIGRSVVVRKVAGGRGGAPIAVAIAVQVVVAIAAFVLGAIIFASMMQGIGDVSGVGA
ncbi:DUF2510 domain-containing protein [Leifsonia sp. NPDC080035]|uniref:DUF2510 domain-containing protein n=1 Tax=Leifsonia sp. NPDC080035 TaxID=3143936 RepID=A0AAU7GIT2_9MICO